MTHSLESLGWTLIHFCWQATAIAAIYAALDGLFSKAKSQARYGMSLIALLLMPIAAVGTFTYEQFQTPAIFTVSSSPAPLQQKLSSMAQQVAISATEAVDAHNVSTLYSANLLLILDAIWIAGVLLLSCRAIGGWWYLRKFTARSNCEIPPSVEAHFDSLCKRLAMVRPVALKISEEVLTPMAIGFFRTVVILPLSVANLLSFEELEVVLAHELAHIRRADYLWNMVQTLVETVFFFHPAVWWLSHRIRDQRELCCDDMAVAACADPVLYASALLRIEEQRRSQMPFAMALNGQGSKITLAARIRRLLGEPPTNKSHLSTHSVAIFACTLALCILPATQLAAKILSPLATKIQAAVSEPPARPTRSEPVLPASAKTAASVASAAPNNMIPKPSPAKEEAEPGEVEPLEQEQENHSSGTTNTYIDKMRAAGYNVDIDKLIAFKVHGITPEYADSFVKVGLPKPSANDLIALKVQGVTADYVAELRKSGIPADNLHEIISFKIFNITPEYVNQINHSGFGALSSKQFLSLKVQGVTPEFARSTKQQFPESTVEDLIQFRVFGIDGAFIESAKKHGFEHLSAKKLVQLRVMGLLD